LARVDGKTVGGAELADRGDAVGDRLVAKGRGLGEHQDRERSARRLRHRVGRCESERRRQRQEPAAPGRPAVASAAVSSGTVDHRATSHARRPRIRPPTPRPPRSKSPSTKPLPCRCRRGILRIQAIGAASAPARNGGGTFDRAVLREEMMPKVAMAWAVAAILCWIPPSAAAMSGKAKAELATAVAGAKVPLEQGLAASKANGKPVSGKFEIENGKPQLSIYTIRDGSKYFEVIVDHNTGAVAKAEPITGGDDLTA